MLQVWTSTYPGARKDIFIDTLNFQIPFLPSIRDSIFWEAFDTDRPGQLSHIHRITDKLRAHEFNSVICPIHDPRNDHYVAVMLDGRSGRLLVGNSLGGLPRLRIEPEVRYGFQRFSAKLGFSMGSVVGELPREIQGDGYSCGIVTLNTIERAVFPHVRPWAKATKYLERAEFALLLATQLGSQYSLVSSS